MLKVEPAGRAAPMQSLPHAARLFGHWCRAAAEATVSPTPFPEGLGGRLPPSPRRSRETQDGPTAGTAQKGAQAVTVTVILLSRFKEARTRAGTPADPRRAAAEFLRETSGLPSLRAKGNPPG